jgi:hypothetical protein
MNANLRIACSLIAIEFTAFAAASAGETSIDISNLVSEPWTFDLPSGGIINGSTFPTGSLNLGGVPFVIPTGPNNYWQAAAAANYESGVASLTIPVGVYGVTSPGALAQLLRGNSSAA